MDTKSNKISNILNNIDERLNPESHHASDWVYLIKPRNSA